MKIEITKLGSVKEKTQGIFQFPPCDNVGCLPVPQYSRETPPLN